MRCFACSSSGDNRCGICNGAAERPNVRHTERPRNRRGREFARQKRRRSVLWRDELRRRLETPTSLAVGVVQQRGFTALALFQINLERPVVSLMVRQRVRSTSLPAVLTWASPRLTISNPMPAIPAAYLRATSCRECHPRQSVHFLPRRAWKNDTESSKTD